MASAPITRYLVERAKRPSPPVAVPVPDAPRAIAPSRRDAFFRRALGTADALAMLVSLSVVTLARGDALALGVVAAVPLFILTAKALGLYDRDEHLLHKTTLDEVPTLFGLATMTTLTLWLADG